MHNPLSIVENTYTYLSLEFDKKIVGSVVKSNDSLEVSRHDSLYDTDVEKAGVTLRDCLDSFTSNEKLGLNDTWLVTYLTSFIMELFTRVLGVGRQFCIL